MLPVLAHRILGTLLLLFRISSVDFTNVPSQVRSGCMLRKTIYDPLFPFNFSTRESICGELALGLLILSETSLNLMLVELELSSLRFI